MDEVFCKADLLGFERLKELCATKSDLRGWLQLTSHLGAIGLTGAAIHLTLGSWWAIAPILLHGTLLNFLYAGEHELSHYTVFKTRWLNEFWGRIIGFIVFQPRDFDQIQHVSHHRYTNLWKQDGQLYREPYTFWSYLLNLSSVLYFPRKVRSIVKNAIGPVRAPFANAKGCKTIEREARWHLAGYLLIFAISLALWTPAALIYWITPMLLTKFIHMLENTIEHEGLPKVANILENTRTIRTNPLMRWMAWQIQYHTAHHAFPGVPFHALKTLHHEMFTARGIRPPTMTYLGFQWAMLRALWEKGEAEQDQGRQWVPPAARQPALAEDATA